MMIRRSSGRSDKTPVNLSSTQPKSCRSYTWALICASLITLRKTLKIYEALAEIKTLEALAEELSKFRASSLLYDADSEPDFKYDELSDRIDKTLERKTELKIAVQSANLSNKVRVGDADVTLARAILDLSIVRAKLTYVSNMLNIERGRGRLFGDERRSRDEIPQKRQKSKAELLEVQTKYTKERNALDAAIQEANHKIEIAA